MTENTRKIFEMLNIEPYERFGVVVDGYVSEFWFDEQLNLFVNEESDNNSVYDKIKKLELAINILNGKYKIIKLPKKKQWSEEEIKIAKACKTLGYNWLARDKDQTLFGYYKKPKLQRILSDGLTTICWAPNNDSMYGEILKNHFPNIKWEDEEPTAVDEIIGDNNEYKAFPNVEEKTKKSIVCGIRRKNNG